MLARRPPSRFALRSAPFRVRTAHNASLKPPSTRRSTGVTGIAIAAAASAAAYYFLRPDTPRGAPTNAAVPISPSHFTPTTIVSSVQTSPTTRVLTLQLPPAARPLSAPGAIWSIYVKDTDIMVERPFTPLYGIDSEGKMELWVKRYDGGEVGRWLHARQPGETIEVRGPTETLRWPWPVGTEWDEVVLISGGTGFAPVFQLLHHQLLSGPPLSSTPRFTLLHSSRTPSELPPTSVLGALHDFAANNPDRLRLHFFVDQPDNLSTPQSRTNTDIAVQRIDSRAVKRAIGYDEPSWWSRWLRADTKPELSQKSVLFLVCGPEPMVAAIAGPYGRNFSQGNVGGILGELGFSSDQVRKL